MKKLLPIILTFGLLFSVPPANSATSCKAVKTKVIALEGKILKELNWLKSRPFFIKTMYGQNEIVLAQWNYNYVIKNSADYARLEKFRGSNHLSDIWKLGTNNPKCFTNTQKIRLKDPDFQKTRLYVDWQLFDTPGEAKTGMPDSEWLDKHSAFLVNEFKSIYKY